MSSICGKGKKSWPELVGARGIDAKRIIEHENPTFDAIIVPPGDAVTTDVQCDRVAVWVDENGLVEKVPRIG